MLRKPNDNSEALAAFLAKKAEIDTALARLTALSANHFDADPDSLHGATWSPLDSTPSNCGA